MKYIVTVREVWVEAYEVEAESEDEAKELVVKDDCMAIEDSFEFSHVQSRDTWDVRPADED